MASVKSLACQPVKLSRQVSIIVLKFAPVALLRHCLLVLLCRVSFMCKGCINLPGVQQQSELIWHRYSVYQRQFWCAVRGLMIHHTRDQTFVEPLTPARLAKCLNMADHGPRFRSRHEPSKATVWDMLQIARFLVDNERLFVVAASTMIMSTSHTALRPVLPVFAKVRNLLLCTPTMSCSDRLKIL